MYKRTLPIISKHIFTIVFLAAAIFSLTDFIYGGLFIQEEYSKEEAVKVMGLIDRIIEEQVRGQGNTQEVTLTEGELNSYIAHRIEMEKPDVLKKLNLKFQKNNEIEGHLLLSFKGKKIPRFLQKEMEIFFSGHLEIQEDRIRLVAKEIFLGGQKIQLSFLKTAIGIASKLQGQEMAGLDDWYDLPFGIKDVQTFPGHVVFYFQ
ncbi:hypothetical protein ACFLT9_07795 [Acidobacteriota bacterium]